MQHLSEKIIQAYLDGIHLKPLTAVENHLSGCSTCRATLENYRRLYKRLQNDSALMLSADFTERVIQRVESGEHRGYRFLEIGMIVMAVLVSLGILWYFFGFTTLIINFFTDASLPELHWMRKIAAAVNQRWMVYLFAVVILTVTALFDRLFLHSRNQP